MHHNQGSYVRAFACLFCYKVKQAQQSENPFHNDSIKNTKLTSACFCVFQIFRDNWRIVVF